MAKRVFKRFFCLFFALTVLFLRSIPVYASGVTPGTSSASGVPVGVEFGVDVVSLADMAWKAGVGVGNFFRHFMDEDVCPMCTDLTAQHDFVPKRTLIDGKVGVYYVCRYCGKSAGEVMETGYQNYVSELPGTQYNSSGAYLWKPKLSDFVRYSITYNDNLYVIQACHSSDGFRTSGYYSFVFSPSNVRNGVLIKSDSTNSSASIFEGDCLLMSPPANVSTSYRSWANWTSVKAPVSGFYTRADGIFLSDSAASSVVGTVFSAGAEISLGFGVISPDSASFRAPWPAFWIAPYTGGSGGNTYEISTRVSGSVSDGGMFGYVENGQLYQSTVTNIYNESTGAYQNPVTGDTATVISWAYDYSDRSYALTTNEGDEITVTYGDSAVTINEGSTTYNVYYLMEETEDIREEMESVCVHDYSSAVTTPPMCMASGVQTFTCSECGHSYTQTVPPTGHNYQSAVTMAPTCVGTGVRTFTCSECGDSYTVSIAATGHTWEVISTVPTTYDSETGQLVQQGYTLYECATCHEQYRISADSGGSSLPAPSSGGTSTGGADLLEIDSDVGRGFLATIAHGLTEDLPEVLEAASQWFTVFPQFYSGFMTFVKDGVAGCLPDTPRLMMGFGFGMTTLIGIVRKIFGR